MSGAAEAGALHRTLDAFADCDPEYDDGLSNHLPMALAALHRLGASPQRLDRYALGFRHRLRAAPAAQRWPAGDPWAGRLGERAAWPAYRDLFAQWLTHEPAGEVLEAVLPRLVQGCAGAAFHGMIRSAYALQTGQRRELADALAYWASCWLRCGPPASEAGREADPAEVLRRLPLPPQPVPGRLIVDRVAVVAAWPGFAAASACLRIDGRTLERLAHGSATLYAASGNFTVLHLLTSAHAMRVLLPLIDEPLPALAAYWQAFAAAWAASGARDRGTVPLHTWTRIVDAAIASDDDHAAKLVDSCREQQAAYGGEVWRLAASRVLREA